MSALDGKNYDFEFCVQLTELMEDFFKDWGEADHLNQPTLLDFASWVSGLTDGLADELGDAIDGEVADD